MANPRVEWFQSDDGTFHATQGDGGKNVPNAGTEDMPFPAPTLIRENLELSNYIAYGNFQDNDQNKYPASAVKEARIHKIEREDSPSYKFIEAYVFDETKITLVTETGYGYLESHYEVYDTRPNGKPKVSVFYPTPFYITWKGVVEETKEIQVNRGQNVTISVGQTKSVKAEVRTKGFTSNTFGDFVDVSARTDTFWQTNNPAVISVDKGVIRGLKEGTATLRATWKSGVYEITAAITVTVTPGEGGPLGDFDPIPPVIAYGDTFKLHPKNIEIPAGRTLSKIEYTIYNPSRTQSKTFTSSSITDISIPRAQYPAFFSSTAEQSYPIDMKVTDSSGATSPIVTKEITIQLPGSYTGDFEIIPPVIDYRNPFTLRPKDIDTDRCTYQYHQFKITRGGVTDITEPIYGRTTDKTYTYSTYPMVIGVGVHDVYMKIVTDCGESEWIGPKPLTVNGPKDNHPPDFILAFVRPEAPTVPVYKAMEGEILNLVIIHDPSVPTPNDPDGDTIELVGFDFSESTAWAKSIPTKYSMGGTGYYGILMDSRGFHANIKATMRDEFGASATKSTYIEIIPPNPVPVITGPSEVVEGRPLPEPFSSENSYSPLPYRKIDHSRDIWTNKRDVYNTPGEEIITLEVFDDAGMKSVEPARHTLTVKPDLPPVPQLEYPAKALRTSEVTFQNTSYSPDGDKIVQNVVTYQYDSNNDGNFDGEPVKTITMAADNTFTYKGSQVGKYKFKVFVKEDWGRQAEKEFMFEVVNDAPYVTFDMTSEIPEPVVIPTIPLNPHDLVNSSYWKNKDVEREDKPKAWAVNTATNTLVNVPVGYYSYSSHRSIQASGFKKQLIGYQWRMLHSTPAVYLKGNSYIVFNDSYSLQVCTNKAGTIELQTCTSTRDHAIVGIDYANEIVHVRDYTNWSSPVYRAYTIDHYISGNLASIYNDSVTSRYVSKGYGDPFYEVLGYPFKTENKQVNGSKTDSRPWNSPHTVSGSVNQVIDVFKTYGGRPTSFDGTGQLYYGRSKFDGHTGSLLNGSLTSGDIGERPLEDGTRYVYSQSSTLYINNISNNQTVKFFQNHRLIGVYKNLIIAEELDSTTGLVKAIRAYNTDGGSVWTSTVNLGTGLEGFTFTNDGYMIVFDHQLNVLLFNLQNGSRSTLGHIRDLVNPYNYDNVQYSVHRISFVKDGVLQVVASNDRESGYYSVLLSSNVGSLDRAIATQHQLLGSTSLQHLNIVYNVRVNQFVSDNLYAGFAFKAQDGRNLLRVEHNGKKLRLVRLKNGTRTVLKEADYTMNQGTFYKVRIQSIDNRHRIYVNDVPLIDVTDTTFGGGTFGPFSEIPKTEFQGMSYANLDVLSQSTKSNSVALIDTDIDYKLNVEDTENDPLAEKLSQWKYVHVSQKFLDAGDGKSGTSAHHNKTYTEPVYRMDKVGHYQVSWTAKDDPHPNYRHPKMEFDNYRETSNTFTRDLIVHRRPVASYTLSLNSDKTVKWNDTSYDPDRWLSATNYSTENTGIDYKTTRGILERRYYYVTPSGKVVYSKLVTPAETGVYTVGMAVKDEYGAWSDYLERQITITQLPQPNTPPVPGFNVSPTTTYRGVQVTIDSTAYDKEDGPRENIAHEYYIRNMTTGDPETLQSNVRTTWKKTFNSMGTFQIRQVVTDSKGESAQITKTIQIVNRKPVSNVTMPSSTDQNNPTKLNVLRPTFQFTYKDDDGDTQKKYQVKIYRYGGYLLLDSGILDGTATTWTPSSNLPERVPLYIVVRAFDGYDWGDYSPAKFFIIETNQAPTANFDWTPKPAWEGDMIRLINQVNDPDKDKLTLTYEVTGPDGNVETFTQTLNHPYSSNGPQFQGKKAGNYRVKLTVSDGKAAPVSVTKTITVQPLTIEADVEHTPEWREQHKRLGHEVANHPKDFYAGEIFLVKAVSAPAPVSEVTASLEATGRDGKEIKSAVKLSNGSGGVVYTAEFYDERWEALASGLKEGLLEIDFQIRYANGTVKQTTVPVNIVGHVKGQVGVHRQR
jgi:hypothetical protein